MSEGAFAGQADVCGLQTLNWVGDFASKTTYVYLLLQRVCPTRNIIRNATRLIFLDLHVVCRSFALMWELSRCPMTGGHHKAHRSADAICQTEASCSEVACSGKLPHFSRHHRKSAGIITSGEKRRHFPNEKFDADKYVDDGRSLTGD